MTEIRRFVLILAALALCLSFAACSGEAVPSNEPTAPYAVTDAAGNDITARVVELWEFANELYRTGDAWGDDVLLEADGQVARSVVEGFDRISECFTEDGVAQLLSARDQSGDPIFYEYGGKYYRRIADGAASGINGAPVGIATLGVNGERITLAITYTDTQTDHDSDCRRYAMFELASVDGVWLVDGYEHPPLVEGSDVEEFVYAENFVGESYYGDVLDDPHRYVPNFTPADLFDTETHDYAAREMMWNIHIRSTWSEVAPAAPGLYYRGFTQLDSELIVATDVTNRLHLLKCYTAEEYAALNDPDAPAYAVAAYMDEIYMWHYTGVIDAPDPESEDYADALRFAEAYESHYRPYLSRMYYDNAVQYDIDIGRTAVLAITYDERGRPEAYFIHALASERNSITPLHMIITVGDFSYAEGGYSIGFATSARAYTGEEWEGVGLELIEE